MAEAQILHLVVNAVQPEAVGDRCVDFQGLARDALAFFRGHCPQGAHVVQAVASLIRMTRTSRAIASNICEILGLGVDFSLEFDLVQLGYAVYQFGYGLAEFIADSCLVMAVSSTTSCSSAAIQGLCIQMPVGQDFGDRQGVRDVGFAALAELAGVGAIAEVVGRLDLGGIFRFEVGQPRCEGGDVGG